MESLLNLKGISWLNSLPEFSAAIKNSQIEYLPGYGGIRTPARIYGGESKGVPVLMLHGLQSHSGWFVQSAHFLASMGSPVYALERRGSGLSEARRGHCENFQELVADVQAAAEVVRQKHQVEQFHLVGHCFGAIAATIFAVRYPQQLKSLILSTPGIYTYADVNFLDKLRILGAVVTGNERYFRVPLKPEMFTDLDTFQKLIREDPLGQNEFTASFLYQTLQARRFLHRHIDHLTMPILMTTAASDRICDNQRNRKFFEQLPSQHKKLIDYPHARHILEFSQEREKFFADLKQWLADCEQNQ